MDGTIAAHSKHSKSALPGTPKVSLEALDNLHRAIEAVNDQRAVHPFFACDDERLTRLLDLLATHVDGWLANTPNRNCRLPSYFDPTPPDFPALEASAAQLCWDIRNYMNLLVQLKPSVQTFATVMIERAEGTPTGIRRLVMYRNPVEVAVEEYVFFELEPNDAPEVLTSMGFHSFNLHPVALSRTDTMRGLADIHNAHVSAHAVGDERFVRGMHAARRARPSQPSTLAEVAEASGVKIEGILKPHGYKREPKTAKKIEIGDADLHVFGDDYVTHVEGARIEVIPERTASNGKGIIPRMKWKGPNGDYI